MGKAGGYNVIVVPDDHSRTRQYRVSRGMVWSMGALATLLAVVVGIFVLTYSRVLLTSRRAGEYAAENTYLKTQLDEVRNLRTELDQLRGLQAQVAIMLGVDPSRLGGDALGADSADSAGVAAALAPAGQWWAAEATGPFRPRQWPVEGYISKEFYRNEEGSRDSHAGIDVVAPFEAPVRAAGRGRVVEARYDERFGNVVVLDHGFGLSTLYGHNERLLVKEGTVVEQGQLIAHLGNTGISSGPHLHFEVRVDGTAVDPRQYLAPPVGGDPLEEAIDPMFGKEPESNAPADSRATSILAQGCTFKGEVQVQGTFRIEGEFEGSIRQPENLVVGKTGVVRGEIHVKNAVIAGNVVGNIVAENKIELQSGSHLEGDIKTRRLVIDEGVYFEGNCSMGDKTASTPQPKSTPSPAPAPKEFAKS